MSDIVVTEFVSLDGVIEAPGGEPEYRHSGWTFKSASGDDHLGYKLDELKNAEAQLLGRVTYEGFAAAWPDRDDEAGFAERMNSMPKYVVSTTLTDPEWQNTTVIPPDPAEVAKLKDRHDGDILVAGSATLIQWLTDNDLVDEYHVMVFPVLLGDGKRMFRVADREQMVPLRLTDSRSYDSGVVVQTYRRAEEG